jgi:alpha-L-fucosidase
MEQRLIEIGEWLKVNGEAIYGTRHAAKTCQWTEGERPEQEFGQSMVNYRLLDQVGQTSVDGKAVKQVFFTRKSDVIYAITAGWPGTTLTLRDLVVTDDRSATMLGVPGKLTTRARGNELVVDVPPLAPESTPCDHAYVFKLTGVAFKNGVSDQ